MRALTSSEIRRVAGGLMPPPTSSPVYVTAPAPPPYYFPTTNPQPNPSQIIGGGGSSSGGTTGGVGSSMVLATSLNDSWGKGDVSLITTSSGQSNQAVISWENYDSTSSVAANSSHIEAFNNVTMDDGVTLSNNLNITDTTVGIGSSLSNGSFSASAEMSNNNLGTATVSFTDPTYGTFSGTFSTNGQMNANVTEKIGDVTITGSESNVTGTAIELSFTATDSAGDSWSLYAIHDSATTATEHAGWGIGATLKVPF